MAFEKSIYDLAYNGDFQSVMSAFDESPKIITTPDSVSFIKFLLTSK